MNITKKRIILTNRSVGKNLFDKDNLALHVFGSTYRWYCLRRVKPNTSYTASLSANAGYYFLLRKYIDFTGDTEAFEAQMYIPAPAVGSVTIVTSASTKYIAVLLESIVAAHVASASWVNVQLEKGSVATAYEPYTGFPSSM